MVDATLANKKSWHGGGKVSFKRVKAGENPTCGSVDLDEHHS